jgi:hypothetical protein
MGTYRHEWDAGVISPSVTAVIAMGVIIARPNDIFPFKVSGPASSITLGVKYDLMNTIGPRNLGQGPDPIEVTSVSATSFTFTTLAGHHRGAGQTITFTTIEKLGHVWLIQSGTFNSLDPRQYAYNAGAIAAWALQAHNLRVALGTVGSSGLGTAEKALDATVSATYLNVWP